MFLSLGLGLFSVFAAVLTFWSRKQMKLNNDLRRELEETRARLAGLQERVQQAIARSALAAQVPVVPLAASEKHENESVEHLIPSRNLLH
jgi:hypothetical protein